MQGGQVWNLMEFGWASPSLKLDGTKRSIGKLKPKQELDNRCSEGNAWALYIIFNKVSPD